MTVVIALDDLLAILVGIERTAVQIISGTLNVESSLDLSQGRKIDPTSRLVL